jgi:hypothetical protein
LPHMASRLTWAMPQITFRCADLPAVSHYLNFSDGDALEKATQRRAAQTN